MKVHGIPTGQGKWLDEVWRVKDWINKTWAVKDKGPVAALVNVEFIAFQLADKPDFREILHAPSIS